MDDAEQDRVIARVMQVTDHEVFRLRTSRRRSYCTTKVSARLCRRR